MAKKAKRMSKAEREFWAAERRAALGDPPVKLTARQAEAVVKEGAPFRRAAILRRAERLPLKARAQARDAVRYVENFRATRPRTRDRALRRTWALGVIAVLRNFAS